MMQYHPEAMAMMMAAMNAQGHPYGSPVMSPPMMPVGPSDPLGSDVYSMRTNYYPHHMGQQQYHLGEGMPSHIAGYTQEGHGGVYRYSNEAESGYDGRVITPLDQQRQTTDNVNVATE
jgi:hypothetical protein